jgi:transposase
MYNLPEVSESTQRLERLVRKEKDARIQRRFQMLLLLKTGEAESRSAAARELGVHRHTVSDWLDLYEEGGIEKIQKIEDPGLEPRQESIPPDVMAPLKDRLDDPEGFGSYKEIQQWLAEKHGVEVPYSTLHGIVRYKLGAKPKTPRPSHPKKTRRSIRISGRAPQQTLKSKCRHARAPVLSGRMPSWADANGSASNYPAWREADSDPKPAYEYFYLYGAVEPETGQRFFYRT